MAIAKVSSLYEGSSNAGNFTTSAINTTGATALIVGMSCYQGYLGSLSDSKGNSYSPLLTQTDASGTSLRLWVLAGPTVGASHTWTTTDGWYAPSVGVLAVSGTLTASVVDLSYSNAATAGTTVKPGSLAPNVANSIIVTLFGSGLSGSVDSPFSVDGTVTATANHQELSLAYEIQSGTTTRDPTWTFADGARVVAAIVNLKPAATGPAKAVLLAHYNQQQAAFNLS